PINVFLKCSTHLFPLFADVHFQIQLTACREFHHTAGSVVNFPGRIIPTVKSGIDLLAGGAGIVKK
ncbi:MAG TPA: hypothetical protein VFD56_12090, partial [Chitinophagaceae bacterium]|nr:hypothetical protein [Chitinophagaceae bacterium]